jgi:hypothetical protein
MAIEGTANWSRTVARMRRVVLDSNAVDPIADLPGAYEAVRRAVDGGQVEILYTHINIDELAMIPDSERRCRLLLVLIDLGHLIPTGAFVLDFSRLNFARLGNDADGTETLRSGRIRHSRDALIAVTAEVEKCALVTNEKRLANRARDCGIEVMTTSELLATLGFRG